MKKNKIFGIGATVLMILVAVIPAVNGIQTNIEKINENELSKNNVDKYDLEVKVVGDALWKYTSTNSDGETYSFFDVKYEIKNVKSEKRYYDTPVTEVRPNNSLYVIDFWTENKIDLDPGESITLSHEVKAFCDFDGEKDEEKILVSNDFVLVSGVKGGNDEDPTNNLDGGESSLWWKNSDPTKSQIIGMTPWFHKKVTNWIDGKRYSFPVPLVGSWQDLWDEILQFLDDINIDLLREAMEDLIDWLWNEVPTHFKNQRLGWVNDFTEYLTELSLYCSIMLLRFGQFIAATWDDFVVIANWIKDLVSVFSTFLISGVLQVSKLTSLITDAGKVFDAIIKIAIAAVNYGGKILDAIDVMNETWEDFQNWLDEEHWEDDITIDVDIHNVDDYKQPITIESREVIRKRSDGDDGSNDNEVEDKFQVPSSPMYLELGYKAPHRCVVKVKATKKDGKNKNIVATQDNNEVTKSSGLLFSYCFSGGTVHKEFRLPEQSSQSEEPEDEKNRSLLQFIFQSIENLKLFLFRSLNLQCLSSNI